MRLSQSTRLSLPSIALVQCAMILTTSSTNTWSGVIFPYQLYTKSLTITAIMAYSCRSMSLLLVSGGRSSSIGHCSVAPAWASGQSTRLIKARTALSDASGCDICERAGEASRLCDGGLERRGGVVPKTRAAVEESLNVGTAFG